MGLTLIRQTHARQDKDKRVDIIVLGMTVVLAGLIPFNLWAAYKLRQIWLRSKGNGDDLLVLKERYRAAGIMAISSVLWGLVIFRHLFSIAPDETLILLGLAAIMSSLPSAIWIYLYYRNVGFDRGNRDSR